MIELPKQKITPVTENPKRLVIYSKPKVGKTTAFALLENNLILDFEGGSDFVEALKIKIPNLAHLREVGSAILADGKPYKYITIDTVTALQDMCLGLALKLYKDTPMGKSFEGDNVLKLPNGAGYLYLREAFFKIIDYVETLVPDGGCIILSGHLTDKMIESKGKEVSAVEIDLTGKLKSLVCSKADAIGLLTRRKNEVFLNFKTSDEITCGARPDHLKNQEILLTELDDSGKIKSNWDKIFKN
jgi:hypothetical protein